jgi:hypothetical protein
VKIRHLAPLIFLLLVTALPAATLTITVHDPSGAVVQGATIAIQPAKGGATSTLTTGPAGTATANSLAPGDYRLTVDKTGFAHSEQTIALTDTAPQTLIVELKIATQESAIGVQANTKSKISPLANSDPNYRLLRDAQLTEGRQVANLVFKRDTATFTFTTGVFTFLTPVMGKTVYAVFSGDATFHLQPIVAIEANYMKLLSGAGEAEEAFSSAVFCFTDATATEIRAASQPAPPAAAAGLAWREFRDRTRNSVDTPRSMLESLLGYNDMENLDADILSDLYTPSRTRFLAYMHGKKHEDFRFLINESGAISALVSPEEVALINYDPGGEHEGIWYMSHLKSEWEKHTASSDEDRRWARALSFHIDTAIGTNNHLAATAGIRLKALVDGVRVVKFGLLPSLRVSSVRVGDTEIPYIQEARKHDGSFYVIFPQALRVNADAEITVSYEGDKVITDAGNGNFAVGARESWYPSLNSFADRATYDLTFRIPKRYSIVSVGKPVDSHVDHDTLVSHWVSEIPLAVAGFNYGDFVKYSKTDEVTGNAFEAYATHEPPPYLARAAISPASAVKNIVVDAENAVRTYEYYFGKLPYGRLAITQQPQFNFGQSWPMLVYLPVSAFMDNTQRWMLMQGSAFRFNDFITEVTPHEVSHQWWGHAVGWATYRDQWLSEGFATFSAGLFLQNTTKGDEYKKYWEQERTRLVDKNEWGLRAGEAIPLVMGLRLNTFHTARFYNSATYSKGGFVLHMLRSLMWDPQSHDDAFIDMMKDFVKTYYNRSPSTEDFEALVAKHMKPGMDLAGDHRMTWFFQQWVYGTSMPKYRFEYSIKDEPEGKVRLTGTLTQSNVTETFRMKVPVYADFDGTGYMRLGQVLVAGNQSSQPFSIILPKRPKKVVANQFNDILAIETVNAQVN